MKPSDITNSTILFSPLNWGMGHVSRSISLLDELIENGNRIIVACDEDQRKIYKCYFDNVRYANHEGYPFEFGGKGNFAWDLSKRMSSLNQRMRQERGEVEKMVDKYKVDVVLSDHRYGFFSMKVPSIFITHQVNLPTRWYEWSVASVHRSLMGLFSTIWVMDESSNRLAGKLSKSSRDKRIEFIGPYTRFSRYEIPKERNGKTVLILSGPDIYAKQLLDAFENQADLIIGRESVIKSTEKFVTPKDWLEQDQIILNASKIISRSGYSTIMDLDYLGAESVLIPTIGQREQVYLAKFHATG